MAFGSIFRRTLFYQSRVGAIAPPSADVTPDQWQMRWQGPPRKLISAAMTLTFVVAPAVVPTPDQWMPAWQGPPRVQQALADGLVFAYAPPVVEDNNQTIDKWKLDWSLKAPPRIPVRTQPFYNYVQPPAAVAAASYAASVTGGFAGRRTLFYQANVYPPAQLAPQPPPASAWQQFAKGPRKSWPPLRAYGFRQFGARFTNTITIDKWKLDWNLAAPPRRPRHTQPYLPYPNVGGTTPAFGLFEPSKWLVPFGRATPKPPRHTQPFFGYPYRDPPVTSCASITNSFAGRRTLFYQARIYSPQQPAAFDNNVTLDKWQFRWDVPPRIKPRPTQPFYGYEPVSEAVAVVGYGSILTQTNRAPKYRRAPYTNITLPSYPFVAFDLIPPDRWLFRFTKAVPPRKPRPTQPFFGYPYAGAAQVHLQSVSATLTTTVTINFCGWGTETEQGELFVVEGEQATAWMVSTESIDTSSTEAEQSTSWGDEDQQDDTSEEEDKQCP